MGDAESYDAPNIFTATSQLSLWMKRAREGETAKWCGLLGLGSAAVLRSSRAKFIEQLGVL